MSKLPTKPEIMEWISDNPTKTSKRDIAKAFGIKGAARIDLKRILKELEAEGHLTKKKRTYRDPDSLPPVTVCRVSEIDQDGDLLLEAVQEDAEEVSAKILFVAKSSDPALAIGDRVLVRLQKVQGEDHAYAARLIRRIQTGPKRLLGIFRKSAEGGRILPIDKGSDREWMVPPGAISGAKDGELVEAEQTGPKARMGSPQGRVIARLGDPTAPKSVSLIAIHQHGIPDDFPEDVIAEAEGAVPVKLDAREDLRDVPLITIDPWNARDRDDAIYAEHDDDAKNEGGFILWVAIADVAHYVRPGSALDREALKRGNSTYFPDRVVPMLPDMLSGDLCSLHADVERACMAVRMVINSKGEKLSHRFTRGLMRSPAALNYQEVQQGMNGDPNDRVAPYLDAVIRPLFAAYEALKKARSARQPLELDLPEREIVLSDAGEVTSVEFKERLDAHRLIEEFMVLANVAAAEELNSKKSPLLFRVHEEPSPEKLESLREIAGASGLTLAKGQVLKTQHINRLLKEAAETEHSEMISMAALRSMTQAYYAPENLGHFGLALRNYAHFTSPIRRYSDLIVHRALIVANGWGDDGLDVEERNRLREIGEHVSDTERRSMLAERDTTDRYLAAYLSERVGATMSGKISGVAKFGMFVKLDDSGADGLVPISSIGREYFFFDRDAQTLTGEKSGLELRLGLPVTVRLSEAAPVTGGLIFELLEVNNKSLPAASGPSRRPTPRRKLAKSRRKADKLKKKKIRRR